MFKSIINFIIKKLVESLFINKVQWQMNFFPYKNMI